jgi:hypothetical protein
MKTISLFLLCLLSLVSCQRTGINKFRFDQCTQVFGAGDAGCELCDWITTHNYQIVQKASEDTFTSVIIFSNSDFETYALDYLTPSELSTLEALATN